MSSLLTVEIQDKLKEVFVTEGLVSAAMIEECQEEGKRTNRQLVAILIEKNIIDDELLTHAIAYVSGVPYVNLLNSTASQDVLALLSPEVAERFMAVPLAEVQNRLAIAMIDANNVQAVDYLANVIQRPIKVFMASEVSVRHILSQYKTDLSAVDEASEVSQTEKATALSEGIKTIAQDSPISRALSTILEHAVKTRASDVHVEPLEDILLIRFRIDGVLRAMMKLPKSIEPALVSRI